ncbi:Dynein heavy chain 9, axonemal [Triplophysa tibetana]|uniref:Dynein axonemal heavy chain 17 n=2 Tax=Cypriniformes TaxID=7952 RepID=A0A5A9PTY0_9TELE|nr:Dynein heavy chain 9, axonemal [Triplophysa tibetana]
MEEQDAQKVDKRFEYLGTYVLKTFQLKSDIWQKCLAKEEQRQTIQDFMDKSDHTTLVVTLNSSGQLIPSFGFVETQKNRAIYFSKRSNKTLSVNTIKTDLIYGDIVHSPLVYFSEVVNEVVVPMLSNKRNHHNLPQVVSQDLIRHVHPFKNSVFVTMGVVKGKTVLPLPEGSDRFEEAAYEREKRFADLQGIHSQFKSPKIVKMTELLLAMDSIYYPAFEKMLQDVVGARNEAREISVFLKPIERLVEDLENVEFNEVKGRIAPLMHTMCLIWANSKYYNTPARVIVLLQEICNLLIQQAQSYLNPEDILKGDVMESLSRVQIAIDVLTHFKNTYEEQKANLSQFRKNEKEVKPWDFSPLMVFAGLDHFMKRLRTIETLLLTVVDMMKLEKLEFGGIQGKSLSQQIQWLHEEFLETYKVFSEKTYDCLDVSNVEFEVDFMKFQNKVDDADCRLGAIFCRVFDDASDLEHAFKVLDMFGSLLERPLLAAKAQSRYPILITMFDNELECCRRLFKSQIQIEEAQGYMPISKNMPAVAGGLKFIQQLQERIQNSYNNFRFINHPYSSKLCDVWTQSVTEKSQYNLQKPLISRDSRTSLISVNFSPQLVSLLREVKYLEARQAEVIPESAADIYSNRELLWQYVANLELTANWYNKIMGSVLEVELPLIQDQLRDIDAKLRDAEESLCWTSQGIWEYIQDVRETVYDMEQRLQMTKNNVEEIHTIMKSWASPIFERKEGKKDALLNLDDKTERLERTYGQIRASGAKIHVLLKENLSLFKTDSSSAQWRSYVDYVDEMLMDGYFSGIESSLKFFLENTDQAPGLAPLFEVQLHLQVPEIVFHPSLELSASEGLYELVECLINNVFMISALVPRLSEHSGFQHYQVLRVVTLSDFSFDNHVAKYSSVNLKADMEDMTDLADMRQLLMERMQRIIRRCCEYRDTFERYAYLYVDDRKEFMRQFLLYGHVLTSEELEAYAEHGVPETFPTLNQFREQVDSYESLYMEVLQLEPVHVFEGWMRVDARAFKNALLNIIKKWSLMFKQHLVDHVTHSLSDLEDFIRLTESGLGKKVEEGDYKGLVEIMGNLMAVKERQSTTDDMFEPLKQTIDLLKTYQQDLPDADLPEKWDSVKKQAVMVKQQVAPLQANEVANLRRKCATFDVEQHTFREQFRKKDFFRSDCVNPHQRLDTSHNQIHELEATMAELIESAKLFDINIPDYRQLKQCRKELPVLKELWDMILAVQSSLNAWETTPWRDINVDEMELECKRFSKEIRTLDKEARSWDAFTGLDSTVKNTLTSLRAVAELQNPAIRPRHWQHLMNATGVRFTMDQDTTLADLLSLNLHHFEDEVRGIVDRAVKEMGMEKVLNELDTTWSSMAFGYEAHPRTNIPLLKSDGELIETLEDNQVQLQNLMSSKYIAFFLEEVSTWQRKLSVADSVISIWFEVQRTWSHLESIFIGSDDIRSQLPEDSHRFDGIDIGFKELAYDANKTPNVVEATNKPGLYSKLEDMQSRLALCEKALAEYLDTKRLAFPRFYFISSADLLDILSNGTDPHQVQRHLSKLFDNMAKMKFETDADGNPAKTGLGMFSKEDEYVPFNEPCDCSGQVEMWLNRVLDSMRATVRHEMTEAVMAYEEKPREQWLFDYPAQVALTGTQIFWTTDVGIAFSRLEEGFENAMKEYYKKQVSQLNTLITMLIGQLNPGDRQKVMTICTIDVHARDVVAKIIAQKVDNSQAFVWLSQLRHRWGENEKHCFANICDAQFLYSYEYLGNTPRLVITPLTDRCYITLTQSLHLVMSGAPAGPAGTGKTETTKDLGRALGIMVYVFNCSEQMDYKSCGNIYKGLAQTGAWGCFDEFNRISVEVLSVVAVQVKSIQDAIRDKKKRFNFMGEDVNLVPSVGIFITMNPGYAGRTELPENLKALFRPCAMVVPDFELICEIMLVAEGFIEARLLARKFITLYQLCKELLSKQDHYDWGLRAIKSVLVVAGSLKRGDPDRPEDQVLMRALRDFNIPKIVTDDMPVFMGLIGDLFPALDVPRKRDMDFEKFVKQSVLDLKLQAEDNFVLKVNLNEKYKLFEGSLIKERQEMDMMGKYEDSKKEATLCLNVYKIGFNCESTISLQVDVHGRTSKSALFPLTFQYETFRKSGNVVQLEELLAVRHSVFVVGNAGTGKSQVLKSLYKTYQNMKRRPVWADLNPKAVTNDELFGIINPATRDWKDGLFSNIMRELANIGHGGPKWIVLDGDIDPMWIESLNTVMDDNKVLTLASNERIPLNPTMRLLFEISHLRTATPATVSRAGILYINPADLGWNPPVSSWIDRREVQPEKANLTILFDKYLPSCLDTLRSRFKKIIPIPEQSMVQMLCYLLECLLIPEHTPPDCHKDLYELYFVFAAVWAFGGTMFQDQACLVHTTETIRVRYFMDRLLERSRPVMLVGNAGTGKSVLVGDKLGSLDPEKYTIKNVPFNYYTTSAMLQAVLEKPLEKKAGRNYGPPGSKSLIYFIDDMNMPEVDAYGTVQPHTLIRQHMDYNHWYDRSKLQLKEIHNVQYVSCMNPTSGSFTINPRLQRHFSIFALSFPGVDALNTIYCSILTQHLRGEGFPQVLQKSCSQLVHLALTFHQRLTSTFLPTAIKFHYIFNLRDLSNIFQGILFCTSECLRTPLDLVKIYLHESNRVYRDKMVDDKDFATFDKIQSEMVKKFYEDMEGTLEETKVMNMYCHFATGIAEPKYMPVQSWESLNKTLLEALDSYNEVNPALNLVLFEDAMSHICRINRILESPRGNALLVGVGGSGKQSLTRLAAFISSLEVFQITLKKGYSIPDLKIDLAALYIKAGVKNIGTVFLMTDAQVTDEKFLVLVNDLLASGEIPDLFPDDEVENIIGSLRNEVRGLGLMDTRENCWKFFIDRVRRQLKVALCFSPVGSKLRVRSRKFPAVVNCTAIDWFHEWPQEALESVSLRFLQEVEHIQPEVKDSVSKFMAYVHVSVNKTSRDYLANERRYNYTTPKSFLEQIKLYQNLLALKKKDLSTKMERLENGLEKLNSTTDQVDDLKGKLAAQEADLKLKNESADKLIKVVGVETEKVAKEKKVADEEEQKVALIAKEVTRKQRDCEEDLAKAEPALIAAQEALNTLNKNNLTELKSFGAPVVAVTNVTAAVMVLMAPGGRVPKDRSWKAAKVMMAKVDAFLDALISFKKENIHENCLKAIQPYLADPEFKPELIAAKSNAAAGLCSWVINIVKFYEVYCEVEPKRQALNKANAELAAAQEKLSVIKAKINQLNENLAKLTAKFKKATADKLRCQQEAETTARTISLANRLVGGLAAEKVRWAVAVSNFKLQERTLCGDVLLITAFVSYLGYFTKRYRLELMDNTWRPYLSQLKVPIPVTEGLDPLTMLMDDADIAAWQNEGLPADRMSTENATILTSCERWPLMVDPQLQGIKWIKNKYGDYLRIIRIGQRGYLDSIERALSVGEVVLIENLEENVDPVLSPLLGRETIKKGRYIKIGDKECEYNPDFRLILHTKLANPHYQPELQAQCTLVNFTVTRDGLEDQLLAAVVSMERPDLEELKSNLTKQQNGFKITLKTLEDNLLSRLSSASGNFLGDIELVENLETTKRTAADIEDKVKEAKVTEAEINTAREHYRPAAARASLLYFIMNDLNKIHPMYQFSLKAFNVVFQNAVLKASPDETLKQRVLNLIDNITSSVFQYTTRGLFECDKLTYTAQLAFQVLLMSKEINPSELDFLLRYPVLPGVTSPVDFLSNHSWGGIKALCNMEEFRNLDRDIEGSVKRWKKFVESECPEKEKFPQEWKNKTALQRLCMMRALRPDRMTYAVRDFVEEKLGSKYVMGRSVDFAVSFEESGAATPIFFILSPGVDPLKEVEKHGRKLGYTFDNKNFHNVSLGQGQEVVAEQALDLAAKEGHWVILQNIHLVAKWLGTLEKKLEQHGEGSHQNFRVFISAEPSSSPEGHIIPQGILENSIKITNEPPMGMQANLHKALDNFNQLTSIDIYSVIMALEEAMGCIPIGSVLNIQGKKSGLLVKTLQGMSDELSLLCPCVDTLEMCARENEFKSILFALCYFHAVVAERRKFGPQGWNRSYPFNTGDLTISVNVLYNYLEANNKVPYDDLRYLFGEIMYGGHITDDWDRRLCRTYLEEFIKSEMMEGELCLAPGFPLPGNMDYNGYHQYIDDAIPAESPYLYGLHPNAEIGFLTQTSEKLFRTVLEMQPRDGGSGEGTGGSRDDKDPTGSGSCAPTGGTLEAEVEGETSTPSATFSREGTLTRRPQGEQHRARNFTATALIGLYGTAPALSPKPDPFQGLAPTYSQCFPVLPGCTCSRSHTPLDCARQTRPHAVARRRVDCWVGRPAETPGRTRAGRPAGMPGGTRAGRSAGMPDGTQVERPAGMPDGTQAERPAGMPDGTQAEGPAGMPAGLPDLTVAGRPAGMPCRTKAGRPAGMPDCVPAGMPGWESTAVVSSRTVPPPRRPPKKYLGLESSGLGTTGLGTTGLGTTGLGTTGLGTTGLGITGLGTTGLDSTGLDSTGLDSTGLDSTGQDSSGQDSSGLDSSGMDSSGLDSTGLGTVLRCLFFFSRATRLGTTLRDSAQRRWIIGMCWDPGLRPVRGIPPHDIEVQRSQHPHLRWRQRIPEAAAEQYRQLRLPKDYLLCGIEEPIDVGPQVVVSLTDAAEVKVVLDEILEKLPDEFNLTELMGKVEERTPYIVVALQECERMNILTQEIRRSLKELNLGLKGELTMTNDMENLQNAIYLDQVPDSWTKLAYPSISGLVIWFTDLLSRIKELETWTTDFTLPSAIWLAGFFNPQSFLTAIMQSMARRNEWPLDKMCLQCDVTKKNREDLSSPPREGAYIHGLFMEGARWDIQVNIFLAGIMVDARLKELTPTMPVIFIRAIPVDKQETRNVYQCPVYKTRQRGPTFSQCGIEMHKALFVCENCVFTPEVQ